jgi:hypothetical protein
MVVSQCRKISEASAMIKPADLGAKAIRLDPEEE